MAFTAKLSKAPTAQDVKTKMLEGHINKLSIGFNVIKHRFEKMGEKSVRILEELKLWEISAVGFPANEMASIETVKSAIPFNNLDIAPMNTPFDSDGASVRVKRWSGNSDSKQMMAHLDLDKETGEGLYLIADVINDELVLVPQAVFDLATTIHSTEELFYLKSHLDKYYAKMRESLNVEIYPDWDSKFVKPETPLDTIKPEDAEPSDSLTSEAQNREVELKLKDIELMESLIDG